MCEQPTETTRRRVIGALTTTAVVGLAGCSSDAAEVTTTGSETPSGGMADTEETAETSTDEGMTETTTGPGSQVRVVHAVPDAPNVDVYVDDEALLEDVPFRAVSEYYAVDSGDHDVRITAAGDPDTVVFEDTMSVPAEATLSIVAYGQLDGDAIEVTAFEDDASPAEDGQSRVRAVHLSPDAPAVDVAVAGESEPLVSGLEFGSASEYATVPAGDYTLEVRPAGESEAVASFDVSLQSGTGYSAFAMGYLQPGDAPADEPFDLTVAVDVEPSGETETAMTATGTGTANATETGTGTTTSSG